MTYQKILYPDLPGPVIRPRLCLCVIDRDELDKRRQRHFEDIAFDVGPNTATFPNDAVSKQLRRALCELAAIAKSLAELNAPHDLRIRDVCAILKDEFSDATIDHIARFLRTSRDRIGGLEFPLRTLADRCIDGAKRPIPSVSFRAAKLDRSKPRPAFMERQRRRYRARAILAG